MKNDGTFAQDQFLTAINSQPASYVWRLRDKKDLMGLNRSKKIAVFPLPADYVVAMQGSLLYAEVKSTSDPVRFSYSQIESGQRSAAVISASCGTLYIFFIYSLHHQKWYQLSATQFAQDIKEGKKSRRFEELEPCSIM